MAIRYNPVRLVSLAIPPVVAALLVWLLLLLPASLVYVLIVWVVASFPVGVLLGHCCLSEEETASS